MIWASWRWRVVWSVPQAFEVSAFGSVWQMTSTVVAQMRPETTVADIIAAAFPCGSITGAPKRMAMQVIGELEQRQRGLRDRQWAIWSRVPQAWVFKALGMWSSVRWLWTEQATPQRYHVSMGIGSGIVIDKKPRRRRMGRVCLESALCARPACRSGLD